MEFHCQTASRRLASHDNTWITWPQTKPKKTAASHLVVTFIFFHHHFKRTEVSLRGASWRSLVSLSQGCVSICQTNLTQAATIEISYRTCWRGRVGEGVWISDKGKPAESHRDTHTSGFDTCSAKVSPRKLTTALATPITFCIPFIRNVNFIRRKSEKTLTRKHLEKKTITLEKMRKWTAKALQVFWINTSQNHVIHPLSI